MTTTTRTIRDGEGKSHCLDVSNDFLVLDGRPCNFLEITHERIMVVANGSQPIAFATAAFWRTIAGSDPSVEDAGELLAYRLAAWTTQQMLMHTLQSTLAQVEQMSAGSPLLPAYRLDPLTEQVLQAFDGSETTTHTLARILKQPPEVVYDWAEQLGLAQPGGEDDVPETEQETSASTEEPTAAGRLEGLHTTESLGETRAPKKGPRKALGAWFFWTPEREKTLEAAVQEAGGLSEMTQATIKRLAAELNWPWKSVEYKISRWKKGPRTREPQEHQSVTQEEDRSETVSGDHCLLRAISISTDSPTGYVAAGR